MAISIGINGFGRIGRVALRIAISRPETFNLCGINARNADLDYMVYMIHVLDETENLACIAPFIIIETDDLKEVRIYLNSLSCIKDRSV